MHKLPPNVLKAICYIRKSREDEEAELRGEDTLAKQRDLMVKDVLTRFDCEYDLAEEVASGDSIRHRPVFRGILPQLGSRYQAIACKDLSRLGRGSYGDMGLVYDIIRDRRIFIITKDAIYDPRNFSDLRMIRFSLFFNREEYEMTLWRLTEGKYDGARDGKWVAGSVPFGYQYNSKMQILEPKEDEAKVVRLIFDWYTAEGLGFRAIATRLRKLGYKSPKGKEHWQPEVIHRILQNPAHQGTLVFRKTQRNKLDGKVMARPKDEHIVVEDAFEAIITKNTWRKTQQRLLQGTTSPRVKLDFSPSELASLVTCNHCDRKMTRQYTVQRYTKMDGSVSRYEKEFLYCLHCGYCVKYHDCESQVLEVLEVLEQLSPLHGDVLRGKIRDLMNVRDNAEIVDTHEITEQLEAKRQVLMKRLERAREYLLDGVFTKEEYEEAKARTESNLIETEQGMMYAIEHSLDQHIDGEDVDVDKVKKGVTSILDVYHALTDRSRKNALLRSLFDEVRLEFVKKGRGRSNPTKFNLHVQLKLEGREC